ncbi:hypothetical protein BDU57DRAFT_571839 [Ampelomyces quisqualis]|uniref:Uncharacterized protein n=1 Tax=Ampelomyces quisqualis TaxID=50730 RepID=A0A6A5QTN6_AMPQU|nr:hypothetical protein BDU57DRAFT_571839 [Ampelomyces quisqualis]
MEEHTSTPTTSPTNQISLSLQAATIALTHFLLEGLALPACLTKHGALLLVFTGGAAVATALYDFLQSNRENRAKFSLAVYHVVRMVENTPEFLALLDRPHDLLKVVDREVSHMIGLHLTKCEAGNVMTELKRKVWSQVDDQRALVAKRRKCKMSVSEDDFACEDRMTGVVSSDMLESSLEKVTVQLQVTPPSLGSPTKSQHLGDIQELEEDGRPDGEDSTAAFPKRKRTSNIPPGESSSNQTPMLKDTIPLPTTASPQMSLKPQLSTIEGSTSSPSPNVQNSMSPSIRGAYRHSFVSISENEDFSPTPPLRPKRPIFTSYGLDYNDKSIYSSPSPPNSARSPTESMLETATYRAFNPKALGNRPYKSTLIKTPKAKKPASTVKSRQLPNTMTLKTGNRKKGTWLMPVKEASSCPDILVPRVTESYVAATRQSEVGLVAVHKEQPHIQDLLQQEQEVEKHQQQEESIVAPLAENQNWPSPLLKFSSPEIDDAEEITGFESPIASIDSPPSATAISPPMPSSPMLSSSEDVYTLEFSKPPASPVDSSLLSDEDFALPASQLDYLLPSEEDLLELKSLVFPFEEDISQPESQLDFFESSDEYVLQPGSPLASWPPYQDISLPASLVYSLLPSDEDVSLGVQVNSTRGSSPMVLIVTKSKASQTLPSEPTTAVIQPPATITPPISLPSSNPSPLPKKRGRSKKDDVLKQNSDTPMPPAKRRGRPKKAVTEPQAPKTPTQPRKLHDSLQTNFQDLQLPNTSQKPEKMRGRTPKPKLQAPVDLASIRKTARKTAFKGAFF